MGQTHNRDFSPAKKWQPAKDFKIGEVIGVTERGNPIKGGRNVYRIECKNKKCLHHKGVESSATGIIRCTRCRSIWDGEKKR